MKTVIAALVLSLALPISAIAESHGANQLREELMTQLPKLGVEIDADMMKMLSDEQVTEMTAVMDGNETDADKRRAVNAMLGN